MLRSRNRGCDGIKSEIWCLQWAERSQNFHLHIHRWPNKLVSDVSRNIRTVSEKRWEVVSSNVWIVGSSQYSFGVGLDQSVSVETVTDEWIPLRITKCPPGRIPSAFTSCQALDQLLLISSSLFRYNSLCLPLYFWWETVLFVHRGRNYRWEAVVCHDWQL